MLYFYRAALEKVCDNLRIVPMSRRGVEVFIYPHPSHRDVNSQAFWVFMPKVKLASVPHDKGPQGLAVGSESVQSLRAKNGGGICGHAGGAPMASAASLFHI